MSVRTGANLNVERCSTSDISLLSADAIALALREGSQDVVVNALRVVQSMTTSNRSLRVQLVDAGVVGLLVDQLAACDASIRLSTIRALYPFALDTRAHAKFLPTNVMTVLLGSLLAGAQDSEELLEALRLLQCLLINPLLRVEFVQLDGISTVASIAFSGRDIQRDRAVFILWMLAAIPAFRSQFPTTKALESLVRVLEDGSGDCIDLTLSAMALLSENEECREALQAHDIPAILHCIVESEARDEVAYRVQLLKELLALQSTP